MLHACMHAFIHSLHTVLNLRGNGRERRSHTYFGGPGPPDLLKRFATFSLATSKKASCSISIHIHFLLRHTHADKNMGYLTNFRLSSFLVASGHFSPGHRASSTGSGQ